MSRVERRPLNPAIAHFRRVHSALPQTRVSYSAFMRRHVFMVGFPKSTNRSFGSCNERYDLLIAELAQAQVTFRPHSFAAERLGGGICAVLLMPPEVVMSFERIKQRWHTQKGRAVNGVTVSPYNERIVGRLFCRAPRRAWMWNSLF
jgi:hypothetical protein